MNDIGQLDIFFKSITPGNNIRLSLLNMILGK